MIGYLEGEIKDVSTGSIILFANGIGFRVFIPTNLKFLEKQTVKLHIHTHLREDNLSLFGFKTPEDLQLFELLISVSGVGPKIGLTIFSVAKTEDIGQAIADSNLNFFTSISGVGKKTAQKIILDLKQKIKRGEIDLEKMEGGSEIVDSLLSLGFQKQEISRIIPKLDSSKPITSQIKDALKLLKNG